MKQNVKFKEFIIIISTLLIIFSVRTILSDDNIEKMPQLIQFVKAEYPSDLIKQNISGTVLLELLVNKAGNVDNVKIINGIHPVLDSNAVTAAKLFRFTPALIKNHAVAVSLQYEYHFSSYDAVDSIMPVINFKGTFLERGTRAPVRDAMIFVTFIDTLDETLPLPFNSYLKKIGEIDGQRFEENQIVVSTDSLGQFSFFSLPACSIQVRLISQGHEEFSFGERITISDVLNVKFYVGRTSYNEYEIVVYGEAEEKEVSRHQLSVHEVRKIPGLSGDAVKVVQAMPGVARQGFISGDVVVRGAPNWDSQYFLDGSTIPLLYHFGGLKSVYNSEALNTIDFYPGGFGTRYGGAIGGVVEIQGRKAASDRLHLQLDVSTIDGYFLAEGPISKNVSVIATARRCFLGDIISFVTKKNPDAFMMTISPYYWDLILRTDVNISKNNHFFLTFFGARDGVNLASSAFSGGSKEISAASDKLSTDEIFAMGILGWDFEITDKIKNSLRYSFNEYKSKQNFAGFFKGNDAKTTNTLRNQFGAKINNKTFFTAGVDLKLTKLNQIFEMVGDDDLVHRDTNKNWFSGMAGIYTNLEIKPFEKLQIIPGLRYDYFNELDYNGSIVPEFWDYENVNNKTPSGETSLRINSRWEFTDKHSLKAAIGNYSQSPQPIGYVTHKKWGNPKLPATKAAHYVAGHEWNITDLISTDIQFYFNKQWNIPEVPTKSQLSNNSDTLLNYTKDGLGRMWGMELLLRHLKSDRFFGWIAYTLSISERYNNSTKKWEIYYEDETHNLQVLGSWHLKNEWDIGFRTRLVSGKPTTPINYVKYNENFDQYQPVYGPNNSARLKPFFQIDLRVDKKIPYQNWIFSFYIDFQNIFWFIYNSPEYEEFNFDYSDKTTISMPPMIGIGSKVEF